MALETITVYIDLQQLAAQKNNNYSLFLAKMVNGQFTVIWQSKGAVASVTNPAVYEYQNTFNITVPSYQVNYGTVTTTSGSVTFSASGLPQSIDISQTVGLDANGIFGIPTNSGLAGGITIDNKLAGNPNAILLDNAGKPIFVNTQSGMDIGTATLTPIDTYQIWFDNLQETGTIIAHNVSNAATVTFSGGTTNQVISFNAAGTWQNGPLAQTFDLGAVADGQAGDPIIVTVLATFSYVLTLGAVTYLANKFLGKFSPNLQCTGFQLQHGNTQLSAQFAGQRNREILATLGGDKYVNAVDLALKSCQADDPKDLGKETWTLSDASLSVSR
jgi:hypothetical protein